MTGITGRIRELPFRGQPGGAQAVLRGGAGVQHVHAETFGLVDPLDDTPGFGRLRVPARRQHDADGHRRAVFDAAGAGRWVTP